MLVPAQE
ncbi:hypothetical protein ECN1_2774, partial [Escherichia coli N1]